MSTDLWRIGRGLPQNDMAYELLQARLLDDVHIVLGRRTIRATSHG